MYRAESLDVDVAVRAVYQQDWPIICLASTWHKTSMMACADLPEFVTTIIYRRHPLVGVALMD